MDLNFEIDEKHNSIRLIKPDSFTPSHIFENGQCFRWEKMGPEHYIGIAHGKVLEVEKIGDDILLSNCTYKEFNDIWYGYFDMDTDYRLIKKKISTDDFSSRAVKFANGLRMLKQEYFEVLVSFLASQNNNIPRIKKIIRSLCERYGRKIIYKGEEYRAFPGKEDFKDISASSLDFCRAGYRCEYFSALSRTEIPLREQLLILDAEKKREALYAIKGIGPKVAECVLLFSGIDPNAFPIDTWVKKIMKEIYGVQGSNEKLREFAFGKFGLMSGTAQQYLFNYARYLKM